MTTSTLPLASRRPLRLWPAVILVVVQSIGLVVVPLAAPAFQSTAMLIGMVCALAVIVWWLVFSRAPWIERLGVPALMIGGVVVTRLFVHRSIENGAMGLLLYVLALPAFSLALVLAGLASRRMSDARRRATYAAAVAVTCVLFTVIRTGGVSGEGGFDFHWRWTPTPEERLLAQAPPLPLAPVARSGAPSPPPAVPQPATPAPVPAARPAAVEVAWTGFRGPRRDGISRGTRINPDWTRQPPVEVWRRPIGPGWSSFAVRGDLLYTQEQRGEDELVSCYRRSTGEPVWAHREPVRFYESNGGAGPRATPTAHGNRVYALGATGVVTALDADTGAEIWSRNAAVDTERQVPGWGFSSSPLIVDDRVIIAASGTMIAYDAATGEVRWIDSDRSASYSSPHFVTLSGVPQVVLLTGGGAISVDPGSGRRLWSHVWSSGGANIVQPAFTADGDVLIAANDMMGGMGMRRLSVSRDAAGWTVIERWTTRGLKPYFNDFVVHEGHAYGFDGTILAAIDLADGTRRWKGGRYGSGQLLLLPEQDLLLVLSEEGGLALVSATPDKHVEIARAPALEGKTWNHPVVAGDLLLVRNGESMAAFRIR